MENKKVFDGIKVVDFSWVLTGPSTAKELALNGATVVKVESHKRPDQIRYNSPYKGNRPGVDHSAAFATYNAGKLSVSLDLGNPKGQEIAKRLIKWADVLNESFTTGVMKGWGLDYESVKLINPSIVYVSSNQMGQYGPHSAFAGYGSNAVALVGFTWVTGWPDRGPTPMWGAYTDYVAPWYSVATIAAALAYRRRTGRGIYIDEAQFETGVTLMEPATMDYMVNGRIAGRNGNRCPYAAPHGVYCCQGEDRWVAIAVFSDKEWKGFCQAIGNPSWTKDLRFSTLKARKENEDELDRLVEEWTQKYTAEQVMLTMQAAGVSAGVAETMQDLFEDPQLRHRGEFIVLDHPKIGAYSNRSPAYKLSKTPWEFKTPAPLLGEHNEYVFKEILGLSDDEIADLLIEGVITTDADLPEMLAAR